jgi:hypothetical protein
VDLVAVLAAAPTVLVVVHATSRFLLDQRATIRDERQGPSVRGEAGLPVVLGADRQLPGLALVGRDQPERVAVAIETRSDGLERHRHGAAVRGEARFGRDPQAIQVVGAWRARQGIPPSGRDA